VDDADADFVAEVVTKGQAKAATYGDRFAYEQEKLF
jgi:hypothetical protein